ncbi:MAG: MFS transporter, partial [Chromatocurvus sp.]
MTAAVGDPSLRVRLGYGIGIYGPMLGWVAGIQYLLYFYTDVAGIDPTRAGIIFMAGMVWDAISDPLTGYLADRTHTRWGRYRPYLLFGAAPFGLSVFLVFSTPSGTSDSAVFWYAMLTSLLFRTAYTVVYMPFTAMIARMTMDYDARMSLTASKTMFTTLANLTISVFFFLLVIRLGGGDEAQGFSRAAAVAGALGALTTWICFAATREGAIPARTSSRAGFGFAATMGGVRHLLSNRAFVFLFLGVATFGGFYGMCLSSVVYVAKYWLG